MLFRSQQKEKKNAKIFLNYCELNEIPVPVMELKFAPKRRFRFDFAWIEEKLAVEIEGGIWIQGRHTRGVGYKSDMEKYNIATSLGWRVLRFTTDQIKKIETYKQIKEVLEQKT